MRLEQRRFTPIPLTPAATPEQLHLFLAKPLRPLHGLLDPSRLQRPDPGGDTYRYTSRPYGVAGWTLQPRVLLRARYAEGELLIEQLESRVQGLGAWQERLSFGMEARIRPCTAGLEAEARVWAELPTAAVVVAGPVLKLGLQQLLDRLERRCQRGLRGRTEAWLERRG